MSENIPITRVTIADDDQVVREGMTQILRADPTIHIVGEAGNGRDALLQAVQLRPDVVVIDLSMPKLDGVSATREILERVPNAAVLAISVYTDMDRAKDVIDAGAMGYVVKAGAARFLLPAVRAVAAGNVFFSPGVSGSLFKKLHQYGALTSADCSA